MEAERDSSAHLGSARARARPSAEMGTLRVNVARVSVEALSERLGSQGFRLEPIPGLPAFLRVVVEPFPVSRTLEHWLGLFYLQQASTGVAALALGAQPGERILDLCAAPGGKASHIAERLGETGVVVAGEVSEGRVRALLGNLYRLGHTGVLAVSGDGRTFPGGALFDRALVDVPCSGEGNPRKGGATRFEASDAFRSHVTGVQRALLRRAVELVRPGGTILYVTCTSAPEENEAVVARALRRFPLSLQPIDLDIPHATGLLRAGSHTFPPDMELAWRLTPEHLDSGGLFVARLRREDGELIPVASQRADDGWSTVPLEFPRDPQKAESARRTLGDGIARLREDLGVPDDVLSRFRWLVRGDNVWMHSCPLWPVDAWGADHSVDPKVNWQFVSMGIRAFRIESGGRLRATNDLLRRLDGSVRNGVVELARGRLLKLLETGELSVQGISDGFVAVRLEGRVIGRAFMRAGRMRSEIPRPHAALLAETLRVSGSAEPTLGKGSG